jgi:hypothetical protein
MPLYRDTTTDLVVDQPKNIGDHPVLGRNLVPYSPEDDECEVEKVVIEKKVAHTAKPKSAVAPKEHADV